VLTPTLVPSRNLSESELADDQHQPRRDARMYWTAVDRRRHSVLLRRSLSNFAATPGLRLPFGYHGHHQNDRVPVRTLEHWFQASKATSRQQFDMILACGLPRAPSTPAVRPRCGPTGNRSNTR
jgi:hypothetical protein